MQITVPGDRGNGGHCWAMVDKVAMVDTVLGPCEICAQNNVKKGVKTPVGHIPVPEGPFKHLVMDYVHMIKISSR